MRRRPCAQQERTRCTSDNFVKRGRATSATVFDLHDIYGPRTQAALPILLRRTPYSAGPYGDTNYVQLGGFLLAMAQQGYIIAFQDVRGRYMSEGEFVDVRPQVTTAQGAAPRATDGGSAQVDESTDTWDSIDWLVKNLPANNGRVAMQGVSYPGFYSAAGGINHHPALRVISPQAPVADWFIGTIPPQWRAYSPHFHFFRASGSRVPLRLGVGGDELGTRRHDFLNSCRCLTSGEWYGDASGSGRMWLTRLDFWQARIYCRTSGHAARGRPSAMVTGGSLRSLKVYRRSRKESRHPNMLLGPWFMVMVGRVRALGRVDIRDCPISWTAAQSLLQSLRRMGQSALPERSC